MRKLFTCLLLCISGLTMLSACDEMMGRERIKGSGHVVKQTREVREFSGVDLRGNMNIYISQGAVRKVEVETDDNVQEYIELEEDGGQLIVKQRNNTSISTNRDIRVYITVPSLNDVSISGSGNIYIKDKFTSTDRMAFSISGSGNLKAGDIDAPEVRADIAGSGNMELKGNTRDVKVSIAGSSDFRQRTAGRERKCGYCRKRRRPRIRQYETGSQHRRQRRCTLPGRRYCKQYEHRGIGFCTQGIVRLIKKILSLRLHLLHLGTPTMTDHPKILVIYFTQTGQLKAIIDNVLAPLQGKADITFEEIVPVTPFPFPWSKQAFYDAMPECVLHRPRAVQPMKVRADEHFDLVIFAYQPWFLSPSQPITAFLQSEDGKRLLRGKNVITLVGARNMWLNPGSA
ncbi:DUF2807 domain-containing protein [Chitinophaga sedimenti]|uniref:head GIN domain-containing protein n=1 Tax=Chitinophaga sedimenti TaxID=2033606 RepID=UPI0020056706|nr:head GIN domain-containing protein [Chitinophaga sedimenti]MCK7557349.1 DUF2807 domain-containing protein [Chitinophaga sedimenti]